jgi:hypothetical protein
MSVQKLLTTKEFSDILSYSFINLRVCKIPFENIIDQV